MNWSCLRSSLLLQVCFLNSFNDKWCCIFLEMSSLSLIALKRTQLFSSSQYNKTFISFLSVFLKWEHSTVQVGNANSLHGTQLAVAVSSAFFLIVPYPSMYIEETPITNNVTGHQFHLCIEESNGSHTRTVSHRLTSHFLPK